MIRNKANYQRHNNNFAVFVIAIFWLTLSSQCVVNAFPDGAPCIYAVMDSMNPLEAVEHQGGLQLFDPPFYIYTEKSCYWRNEPIELTLQGNSTKDKFKGFAIQPLIFDGSRRGQRIGQFLRLDDNGSWQQQCFRFKNSVTHSHDEPKARMRLWWKNDENDENVVQFVATVVVSLRKFWVRSVVSIPLPPCRNQRAMVEWRRAPVTLPPPVSSFKLDTFRMFNREQSSFLEQSFANVPDRGKQQLPIFKPQPVLVTTIRPFVVAQTFAPQTFVPRTIASVFVTPAPSSMTTRMHLGHVIPIAEMETNSRPNRTLITQQETFLQQPTRIQQQQQQQQGFNSRQQQIFIQQQQRFRQQQQERQQQRQMRPSFVQTNVCQDTDTSQQCAGWIAFCPVSTYMQAFCRRTCRFC